MTKPWPRGTEVIKIPCPPKCACDGREIPPDTLGIIASTPAETRRERNPTNGEVEYYYRIDWERPDDTMRWWTFAHGFEPVTGHVPDMFYLEGV